MISYRQQPAPLAISIADLSTEFDNDPRVLDVRLACALQFKRPADIRPLIERHMGDLSRFGEVIRTVRKTSEKGGRPARETWLNKKQALYICTKSETSLATEVTIQMVEVYDAYTAGQADMVSVRAHERRPSTKLDNAISLARSADRLERVAKTLSFPQHRALSAMVVNGEPVVVDIDDFDPTKADNFVVIKWDGSLSVEPVTRPTGHGFAGSRSAQTAWKPGGPLARAPMPRVSSLSARWSHRRRCSPPHHCNCQTTTGVGRRSIAIRF